MNGSFSSDTVMGEMWGWRYIGGHCGGLLYVCMCVYVLCIYVCMYVRVCMYVCISCQIISWKIVNIYGMAEVWKWWVV